MSDGSLHKVRATECLSSIADRYGVLPETIWNHAANDRLRELRKNPNQLSPGDQVFVPDRRRASESRAAGERHSFRRKGVPVLFRMRLLENDEPVANEAYELHVDARIYEGSTDERGYIEHPIPPQSRKGKLIVPNRLIDCELALGTLDPIETVEGVQARINNLGIDCGEVDGEAGPKTRAAIASFQRKHGLEVTGEIDDVTRDKLSEIHEN